VSEERLNPLPFAAGSHLQLLCESATQRIGKQRGRALLSAATPPLLSYSRNPISWLGGRPVTQHCFNLRGGDKDRSIGTETMTPMNALLLRATMRPDGIAFIYDDVVWTHRDLLGRADRLSRAFLARGIRSGDRVVIHMPNHPEMAVALYACFRIGAIACPTNLRFKTAELRELFERLQPALYLGEEQLCSQVEPIEPEILRAEKRFVTGPRGAYKGAMPWSALLIREATGPRLTPAEPDKDAPAVLLTTSGTTGRPKFVTHTPATLSATLEALAHPDFDTAQTVLNACPMVHGTGLFTFLLSVHCGAPMVMVECFDADAVLDRIQSHGCTWILGLPFMYNALLEQQRRRPRKVSSLQHCLCGGDVCPIQLQAGFEATFGTPLRNIWATTEAVGALTVGLRPGPVARIAPGAQVRLVDDEGRDVPRGEVGEFLVRGPNVTVGYWGGPDRIDDATRDGWYQSGDLMRQGEADELWFVGRKKDIIIRGGSNISPVEVERVLLSHPLVRDAAVFGVPDPVLGERVAAVVQLSSGAINAALGDIVKDIRQQLADYKAPERIFAVDRVPRNSLGKVDRRAAAMAMLDRAA
jgi:long-chain acyl-CoA synthetase